MLFFSVKLFGENIFEIVNSVPGGEGARGQVVRGLPGQGEVHHDPAVQAPLHLQGLPPASPALQKRGPHLPHLPEANPADDQGLLVIYYL
jgi:hypothetical protein